MTAVWINRTDAWEMSSTVAETWKHSTPVLLFMPFRRLRGDAEEALSMLWPLTVPEDPGSLLLPLSHVSNSTLSIKSLKSRSPPAMTTGHFPSSPHSLCEAVHSMILPVSPKPQPPSNQFSLTQEPPPCLRRSSGTHPKLIFLIFLHFLPPFPPPASGLSEGTPQLYQSGTTSLEISVSPEEEVRTGQTAQDASL